MKKLLIFSMALVMISFISADKPLTKEEREKATTLLKDTETGVEKAIAGLSEDQLQFRASDSTWSVEGCVKHIAITEQMLWQTVEQALAKPVNPEKRSSIKATDEQVVQMIESRAQKVKTMDPMKPENTPFTSTEDALKSFKENREKLINFVNTTQEDLRNRVIEFPFASFDAYQVILFIAAHSNRHTQQIDEVKAQAAFPKN
jgi:hypothetical protein